MQSVTDEVSVYGPFPRGADKPPTGISCLGECRRRKTGLVGLQLRMRVVPEERIFGRFDP